MAASDNMILHVYEITKGNIDNFVRYSHESNEISKISSALVAHSVLCKYLDKDPEDSSIIEIWQAPIPFSRGLAYATLFRFNPYDSAYLVSPVKMDWLEKEIHWGPKKSTT